MCLAISSGKHTTVLHFTTLPNVNERTADAVQCLVNEENSSLNKEDM
jgi:hypothetical protein